jgi:hypothetical protein
MDKVFTKSICRDGNRAGVQYGGGDRCRNVDSLTGTPCRQATQLSSDFRFAVGRWSLIIVPMLVRERMDRVSASGELPEGTAFGRRILVSKRSHGRDEAVYGAWRADWRSAKAGCSGKHIRRAKKVAAAREGQVSPGRRAFAGDSGRNTSIFSAGRGLRVAGEYGRVADPLV